MIEKLLHDVSGEGPGNVFLITDEKNYLLDAGMSFCGEMMAEKVHAILKDRPLDYVFLTHSHYDHVSGLPYVRRIWPDVKVVIDPYGKKVLERPGALAVMRSMNAAAALANSCPAPDYPDEALHADIETHDGMIFDCGKTTVTVIDTPGHTKDTVSYVIELKESGEKLLLCSETAGAYNGSHGFIACHLTSFNQSLLSIKKLQQVHAEHVLCSHHGLVEGRSSDDLMAEAEQTILRAYRDIHAEAVKDIPQEDKIRNLTYHYWPESVRLLQPYEAYSANMAAMLKVILTEDALPAPAPEQ